MRETMINGSSAIRAAKGNGKGISGDIISFPYMPDTTEQKRSRVRRFLEVLGVLNMANSQQKTEQSVNYATVLVLLAVLGAIGGLYSWTAKINYEYGYERGRTEMEKQVILERLQRAEQQLAESARRQQEENAQGRSVGSGPDARRK